jgi:hypothetical protein
VRVNAYKSTVRGDVPLENARIHFEKDGEEIVAGDVRNGVFQYKLPASNYNVWIEYQGVKVGEKMVQHNGPTQVSMPTEVYEVSLFVVDLAENPISGIDVKFVRDDKLITTGSTDGEGKLIVSLAKGEYDVECAIEGKKYSYLIAVNGVGSKVLLAERTDNLQLLTPLIASASLGGIAIFSLAMSFRVRTPRRGAARGGGGMDWRRPQRKPIKKNV